MAQAIQNPPYRRVGFIFAAPDEPGIRAAVAVALAHGECGVAVVTGLPDLPGRGFARRLRVIRNWMSG